MKTNLVTLLLAAVLAVVSCEKEDATGAGVIAETDILSAEEEVMMDVDVTFLDDISNEMGEMNMGSLTERTSGEWSSGNVADSLPPDPCATRTWEVIDSFHRVLTIDFGPEPCLCRDSLYRKGMVIIHFEGRRGAPGFKKTITHRDYYVNRKKIEGKITIVYQGNFSWIRTLENGRITFPDSTVARRQSRHVIQQVEGMRVPGPRGDVFKVNGTANGTNRRGEQYISNIREPLIRRIEPGCARVFVRGVVVTKTGNGSEAILNYDPVGTAPCDRVASLTINGVTKLIRL